MCACRGRSGGRVVHRPSDASAVPETHKGLLLRPQVSWEYAYVLRLCTLAKREVILLMSKPSNRVATECSECFDCAWQCGLRDSVDRRAGDVTLLFLPLPMLRPRF